jgi:uncharacterized protein (UPF0332 family)
MNFRDFLILADELATANRETDWRTAVSRAYFAAFHGARQLLQQGGFDVPRGDQAHAYLWLRLAHCGHADLEVEGTRLNDMRRMRNKADYDLDTALEQKTALGTVRSAFQLVDILDEVPSVSEVRTRIIEAMKTYERDVLRQVTWHA